MNTALDYSEINSRKFYLINNEINETNKFEIEKYYLLLNNFANYDLKEYSYNLVEKNFRNVNTKLAKIEFENKADLKVALNNFDENDIFEHDINLIHKSLVKNKIKFFDKEPKILAFDIETESNYGFPDSKYDKILSIS